MQPVKTGEKLKGADKLSRIPIKVVQPETRLKKPSWVRARIPQNKKFFEIKKLLRDESLYTVCEEASCPNIGECFSKGTATFMIMGDICTRCCPFCDVAHGRPLPLDTEEPSRIAYSADIMQLNYVVLTSVDRDDLRDGGAAHFAACISAIKTKQPRTKVEILVPDFRGRLEKALQILMATPPDVMNHNLETVPRLYKSARPGASYEHSLHLLSRYKELRPEATTKSGLMVGIGESDEEIVQVMKDMRQHAIDMITIGQYLQPTLNHLPVRRYVPLETFDNWKKIAHDLGFKHAAIGPMVRSSYHADHQAEALEQPFQHRTIQDA
mgnify:FL=1